RAIETDTTGSDLPEAGYARFVLAVNERRRPLDDATGTRRRQDYQRETVILSLEAVFNADACHGFDHQSRSANHADVRRLKALGAPIHVELHLLTLGERAEAVRLNGALMAENVFPHLLLDESKTLRVVEPLHCSSSHFCFSLFFGVTNSDFVALPDGPRP